MSIIDIDELYSRYSKFGSEITFKIIRTESNLYKGLCYICYVGVNDTSRGCLLSEEKVLFFKAQLNRLLDMYSASTTDLDMILTTHPCFEILHQHFAFSERYDTNTIKWH